MTPGSLAAVAAAALEALASRRDMLAEGEEEKEKEICPGDNPYLELLCLRERRNGRRRTEPRRQIEGCGGK